MTIYELNSIMAVTLFAVILWMFVIWYDPKAADSIAASLTKRARAKRAAREAYKKAWHQGEQGTLPLEGNYEYISNGLALDRKCSPQCTSHHGGACDC